MWVTAGDITAQLNDPLAQSCFDQAMECFQAMYLSDACTSNVMPRPDLMANLDGSVDRIAPAVRHSASFLRALDALLREANVMVSRSRARVLSAASLEPDSDGVNAFLRAGVADLAGAMNIYRKLGDIPAAADCLLVCPFAPIIRCVLLCYRCVPKFWTHLRKAYACAQRPGLPQACGCG